MVRTKQPGSNYYLFINLALVIALSGAVVLIANNLEWIPALVFIGVFSALAIWLGYTGYQQHKKNYMPAARIWYFWAGIAYGLAVFSGAHLFGLTHFIPDLLLLWFIGLTLLAVWGHSTLQLGLAALLNLAWFYLVFLYDQSYLPGLVILAVTYWFLLRRRPSSWLFIVAVVTTLLLANLYFYELIHPAHYPLHFSLSHLIFTVAFLGSLSGLAALQFEAPAWADYAYILKVLTTILGVALLIALSLPPVWDTLIPAFDGGLAGVLTGIILLVITAVPLFTHPATLEQRLTFLTWCLGFILLVAGLFEWVTGVRAFMPTAAALLATGIAVSWLITGLRRLSLWPLFFGLGLLTLICLIVLMVWSWAYIASASILFGLAAVVFVIAERYRSMLQQRAEAQLEPQPSESTLAVS
jgi:hypothetical protein